MLTASSAVKAKELLIAAEVPTDLPAIAHAHAAIDKELYNTTNIVATIVDFEASSRSSSLCPGASKHIVVSEGADDELDALRAQYAQIEQELNRQALAESSRLDRLGMLPQGSRELYIGASRGELSRRRRPHRRRRATSAAAPAAAARRPLPPRPSRTHAPRSLVRSVHAAARLPDQAALPGSHAGADARGGGGVRARTGGAALPV
jgi:hypothetical protein